LVKFEQRFAADEDCLDYLDEYKFRFYRRKSHSRGKFFYRLAQQALMVDPYPRTTLKLLNGPSLEDEFDITEHNMLG